MTWGGLAFANVYTVTNTNDSGAGSLRQAITDANSHSGIDMIAFNISGTGPTITVSSSLPNITDPVMIDGTTQPGFVSGTQSTYVKVGTSYTGTIFTASNVTGLTIKGLDLSYSSPRVGAGIGLSTCNQTYTIDNFIRNRNIGISINGGQDHTVQNNDLVGSGQDVNQPAIYLQNITEGNISSGVALSGNKFGNSNQAFRIQNMNNLLIGGTSVAGANIVIESTSGLTTTGQNGQFVFYFINVNNITVDNVDMSWTGGGASNSWGVVFSNNLTNVGFTVKNCNVMNRWGGISCSGGKDYTIQNNDFRGSGENEQFSVELTNIIPANLSGGVLMSGNAWGNSTQYPSRGGLKLTNMNNLYIGDANTGVQIKIEDNSGFNN
jgi:uncharacterized membrane protein